MIRILDTAQLTNPFPMAAKVSALNYVYVVVIMS
jgi:hypothetical protein